MDWNRNIETYRAALSRIVAGLIAMVELAGGAMPERISRPVYRAVLMVLRPAESAVRRLIVIAARGIVEKPSQFRPMPAGLEISRNGNARASFQLFDTLKRFDFDRPRRTGPRIEPRVHFFLDDSPLVPMFRPQPQPQILPEPEPDDTIGAARLGRRLEAVRMALDNMPYQAKRLARWRARHSFMAKAIIRSPLRPGPPPGIHQKQRHEVEWVLERCHFLAWETLHNNTS